MVQTAAFWDKIANKYAARPIADEDAYEVKLKKTQEFFTQEMEVLEFGCGTGGTALTHAPHVNRYTAIDISSKMIEIAKQKQGNELSDKLNFRVATLDEYQSVSEAYDAILGLSILHLLSDYREVIQQVYKMLKPGGIFVTNTGCLNDHMSLMRFIIPIMQFFRFAPHVEFFSRADLENAMETAGFELEFKWMPPKTKTSYFLIARKPE